MCCPARIQELAEREEELRDRIEVYQRRIHLNVFQKGAGAVEAQLRNNAAKIWAMSELLDCTAELERVDRESRVLLKMACAGCPDQCGASMVGPTE